MNINQKEKEILTKIILNTHFENIARLLIFSIINRDYLNKELETKQYKCLTNLSQDSKHLYEKAIQSTNLDAYISNKAKDIYENKLNNTYSFWVNVEYRDLSKFWNVFYAIRDYHKSS